MQLSILESRLKYEIPEEFHETIEKEFAKFEMETNRMSPKDEDIGQATLTRREIRKAETTNEKGRYGHTVIELQCLKAVALHHGIDDWLSYIDPELTWEENKQILEREGKPTSKNLNKVRSQERWM